MITVASSSVLQSVGCSAFRNGEDVPCGIKLKGWSFKASTGTILSQSELLVMGKTLSNPYFSRFPVPFCVPGSLGSLKPCACGSALVMGVRMHLPECVFGHNTLKITHASSGTIIKFDATSALRRWAQLSINAGSSDLKIPAAELWNKSKDMSSFNTKVNVQDFDWTYTNDYKGTTTGRLFNFFSKNTMYKAQPLIRGGWDCADDGCEDTKCLHKDKNLKTFVENKKVEGNPNPHFKKVEKSPNPHCSTPLWSTSKPGEINIELLKQREEILLYSHLILYEDFLHDNGYCCLDVKM